jgi:hypothetical protein
MSQVILYRVPGPRQAARAAPPPPWSDCAGREAREHRRRAIAGVDQVAVSSRLPGAVVVGATRLPVTSFSGLRLALGRDDRSRLNSVLRCPRPLRRCGRVLRCKRL